VLFVFWVVFGLVWFLGVLLGFYYVIYSCFVGVFSYSSDDLDCFSRTLERKT
jgi:hypothetical protein